MTLGVNAAAVFTSASGAGYNHQSLSAPSSSPLNQRSISYDPATNSYTYASDFKDHSSAPGPTPLTLYTFSPSDIDASNSTASVTAYKRTDSAGNVTLLRLLVPGAGNPTIALTYTSLGFFSFTGPPPASAVPSTNEFFVFGNVAPISGMPTSGTGTYSGINQGFYYDRVGSKLYQTSGTTSLSVNFATGRGSVNFSFTGADVVTGAASLPSQSFTGTFSGTYNAPTFSGPSSFQGLLTGPNPQLNGTFGGNYFGPNGTEFGFIYLAGEGGPTAPTAWGASVGKAD